MHRPSALVVTPNPVLGAAYRDRLQDLGLSTELAPNGEGALATATQQPPQALIVDLMLPTMPAAELIRMVRAVPQMKEIPIFAMPTVHAKLTESAQEAGAGTILNRSSNPIDQLANAVRTAFKLPETAGRTPFGNQPPSGTAVLLAEVRSTLHAISRDTSNPLEWRTLLKQVHHVSEAIALSGQEAPTQIGFAFEALAADLAGMPEQANPSVLNTMSQAADFLGTLLQRSTPPVANTPSPARVLIVDDEVSTLQIVTAAVRAVGLASTEAGTPSDALDAVRTSHFDLIFLDVGLPQMSGFDLCSQLRATSDHDATPVVFLTGMATFTNRAKSSLSGGDDFVGKPFNLRELGLKALIWLYKGR